MADKFDALMKTVADEADAKVDYAAMPILSEYLPHTPQISNISDLLKNSRPVGDRAPDRATV